MPATVSNRAADNWRLLTAIANEAGGRWPNLARSLATQITPDAEADESSAIGVLRDIREAFEQEETDRMATTSLLFMLNADLDNLRRQRIRKGSPITGQRLAPDVAAVRNFPEDHPVPRGNFEGLLLNDFKDAFERYLD
jgi:hypothetical protein